MIKLGELARRWRIMRGRLRWGWRLGELGSWVDLGRCREANNPRCIAIGSCVRIGDGWMMCDLAPESVTQRPKITIGDWCMIMHNFQCNAAVSVEIEHHVLCAANVLITDSDHVVHPDQNTTGNLELRSKPVVVEHNCWIGQNAVILKGVRIGHHSIVGANAVVTRDVAPGSVVGGVPARVIGRSDAKIGTAAAMSACAEVQGRKS